MDVGLGKLLELVIDMEAWRAVIHGVAKSQIWLSDWTDFAEKKREKTKHPEHRTPLWEGNQKENQGKQIIKEIWQEKISQLKDISYQIEGLSNKKGKIYSKFQSWDILEHQKQREISVSRKKTIGQKLKFGMGSGFSKKMWKFGGSEAKSPLSDLMQNYISGLLSKKVEF